MFIQIPEVPGLENQIKTLVFQATQEALEQYKKSLISKDYFSLREAREYIGVSNATFSKFRTMGLKVMVVDSVSRVSKKELDRFMEENSY